jgi:Bacteriophage baseplate protein W
VNAIAHPWRLTPARQLGTAATEHHVADLVRLVLLTSPGERLHRPDLGAGLGAVALFEAADPQRVALVEMQARAALRSALGDRIELLDVIVTLSGDSTIVASVTYQVEPMIQATTIQAVVHG